jgi:hypothetical protein
MAAAIRHVAAVNGFLVVSTAVILAQLLRFDTTPATLAGLTSLGYLIISILVIGSWAWLLTIYRTPAPGIVGRRSDHFRRLWTQAPKWIQIRQWHELIVDGPSRLDFGERYLFDNARIQWVVLRET